VTTIDELHGAVVVRNGTVVLEQYGTGDDHAWDRPLGPVTFGPDTLHDLRSVTKSVVALLYGTALADGLVPAPGEPLLRHFPQYPDLAADPARAALTVEHALTMTLGVQWREDVPYTSPANAEIAMEHAPDRYRYILQQPIVEPPGTRWHYCGGASALLGHLITAGTGQPLPQYAQQVLFEPLGIEHHEWHRGTDGIASPASGLRLTPRDLARIGEHVRAGSDWITTMLRPRHTTDWGAGYGYHWYREHIAGHPFAAALGNGGQRLLVSPELQLTIAITAGAYDDPQQWRAPQAFAETVVESLR
jgi:CubicO group peptidase (beta-lactamase class C family)